MGGGGCVGGKEESGIRMITNHSNPTFLIILMMLMFETFSEDASGNKSSKQSNIHFGYYF